MTTTISTRPVANKQDLLERLRANHSRLKSYGVRRYGIFGSFVRDEARDDSDVDLLIEFYPGKKTFDNFMELGFFLEDLLGRKVETLTPEWLSPYIGPHILREVEYAEIDR
jgi:predicted nucleotidyltransferase